MRIIRNWIAQRLVSRAMRTPYSHLPDYMNRYWLVPYKDPSRGHGCGPVPFRTRPVAWVLQRLGIAVRIHRIYRSDDAGAFHDHPWWFLTWIMGGGYTEIMPYLDWNSDYVGHRRRYYKTGSVLFRRPGTWHRLEMRTDSGRPVHQAWTLFITGPRRQEWGFLRPGSKEKIPYQDYVGA